MIRFGPMSITLLVGALYGLLFAALLLASPSNRVANRFLALLMLAFVLRMVPYIIGFAGYYDAYPWLSFAPYNVSLAFGPLLYFYVRSLSQPTLPQGWGWHFAPVATQFAYYCIIFAQPLEFKNAWDSQWHVALIHPAELVFTFASMGAYWQASWRRLSAYESWMAAHVSQLEDHRLHWVRNFLVAIAITMLLWLCMVAYERFVAPLRYAHRFPFYVWLGVLVYYLGTEGFRHARHRYPLWVRPETESPAAFVTVAAAEVAQARLTASAVPVHKEVDWSQRAAAWHQQLQAEEWWRDPELSLASLARKLGTNTSDLSRAINDGLRMNFNEMVNRLRVEAVKSAIASRPADSVLDLALAAGFNSKASFNRSFKLYTGVTPTAWREAQHQRESALSVTSGK
jgi:AraC-like DNA-binding protein